MLNREGTRASRASGAWTTVAAWVIAIVIVLLPLLSAVQTLIGTLAFVGVVVLLVSKVRDVRWTADTDARTWIATWPQPIALAAAAVVVLILLATRL